MLVTSNAMQAGVSLLISEQFVELNSAKPHPEATYNRKPEFFRGYFAQVCKETRFLIVIHIIATFAVIL